jgi:hypothetical protein
METTSAIPCPLACLSPVGHVTGRVSHGLFLPHRAHASAFCLPPQAWIYMASSLPVVHATGQVSQGPHHAPMFVYATSMGLSKLSSSPVDGLIGYGVHGSQ